MRLHASEEEVKYGTKLYELLWSLQGTDYFLAYTELFPGHYGADTIISHYQILRDIKNRELLRLLHQKQQNGGMSLEDIAARLSIKPDEVRSRIEFFRNNGMRIDISFNE